MSRNRGSRSLILAAICLSIAAPARSQNPNLPAALSAAQIVDQMQLHNQRRIAEFRHYHSVRHYRVEYRGFSTTIDAEMVVEADYDAVSGKSFRIVSQSGSKLLCEKVLKRAIDSEKEASQDKNSTALTPANYRFQLVGADNLAGRPAYILYVDPITPSKFLYRGRIWVDAADFAVAKVDAEPSKSPSFWIVRTLIRFTNAKTGDFWLPEQTRSETRVRIGGAAVLSIDFGTYQVAPEQSQPAAGL
jgi:hypothetical protein